MLCISVRLGSDAVGDTDNGGDEAVIKILQNRRAFHLFFSFRFGHLVAACFSFEPENRKVHGLRLPFGAGGAGKLMKAVRTRAYESPV